MWKHTIDMPAYKAKLKIEIDKPRKEITGDDVLRMIHQAASELVDELTPSIDDHGEIKWPSLLPVRLPPDLDGQIREFVASDDFRLLEGLAGLEQLDEDDGIN